MFNADYFWKGFIFAGYICLLDYCLNRMKYNFIKQFLNPNNWDELDNYTQLINRENIKPTEEVKVSVNAVLIDVSNTPEAIDNAVMQVLDRGKLVNLNFDRDFYSQVKIKNNEYENTLNECNKLHFKKIDINRLASICLEGFIIKDIYIDADYKNTLIIDNCIIGTLNLNQLSSAEQITNLTLRNCSISDLIIRTPTLDKLEIFNCKIANIYCKPIQSKSAIARTINIKNSALYKDKGLYPAEDAQSYRNFREHLAVMGNNYLEHLFNAEVLRMERYEEKDEVLKKLNWLYDFFASYGNSPQRILGWIFFITSLSFIFIHLFDQSILVINNDFGEY